MEPMTRFLKNQLFFVVLFFVVGGDLLLWNLKVPAITWVDYTYSVVLVFLIVFEFVKPRNASWNYITKNGVKFRELSADVIFLIIEAAALSTAIFLLSTWLSDHIRAFFGLKYQLDLHWALQCIAAVFIMDFVRYWIHRSMHRVPLLWRIHSMHHMPERLGAMSEARGNPLDDLIMYPPEFIVLFVLGFDKEVMLGLYSVIWILPLITHSNVEFPATRFSSFFQLPIYHLIHHAYNDGKTPTHNFAEILTFWDRVFGTFNAGPISVDHRTGVVSDKPRAWYREFFGWLYLPTNRL
jgi:sterol desaturase/sphingolipid hydroxylase (fatty acid hydroxylase superfamily)